MRKPKLVFLIIAFALAFNSLLPAEVGTKASSIGRAGDWGFLFNFKNLLVDILPYDDGFQSGLGIKYWVKESIALRGLFGLYFNSYKAAGDTTADTHTTLALGAGAEFHPRSAKVSPYFGPFAGWKMEKVLDVTENGFYLGVMGGVEFRVIDCLSLFGEYQLRYSSDSTGSTVTVADIDTPANGAIFGLSIYF